MQSKKLFEFFHKEILHAPRHFTYKNVLYFAHKNMRKNEGDEKHLSIKRKYEGESESCCYTSSSVFIPDAKVYLDRKCMSSYGYLVEK